MGGEEGAVPFTFNFFAAPGSEQRASAGSAASDDSSKGRGAEAEARETAAAEAQADLLLAGPAAGEGPAEWQYDEVAEELEGLSPHHGEVRARRLAWHPGDGCRSHAGRVCACTEATSRV